MASIDSLGDDPLVRLKNLLLLLAEFFLFSFQRIVIVLGTGFIIILALLYLIFEVIFRPAP